jgi:pimeloyl-ACP methyl ester carboxylesterase
MRRILLLLVFLLPFVSFGQEEIPAIYFLSGQGSDKRLFDSLTIDPRFEKHYILYSTPSRKATMESFARELAQQIDTTRPFVLVGVSLGGMLCVEMGEFLSPEKIILISSAKNRTEFPFRYRFQRFVPVYYLVPGCIVNAGAKLLQPLVEPDSKHNKETFKSMLSSKNNVYMRRTVRIVMQWKRTTNSRDVVHIHGNNDHTLPIRALKEVDYCVENGSHMMTLTRAPEISALLGKELEIYLEPAVFHSP